VSGATLTDLSAEKYHADPAPVPSLSSSIASILLDQSPLHAWLAHPRLNPKFEREGDSRFDLGSAAHMMLLERRSDAIVRVDAKDWRTNAAKEARDMAQVQGKYAVLEHQYGDIVRMVQAAREFVEESELGHILDEGDAEQTLVWQDGAVHCRARPDLVSKDRRIIVDYKTTESAQPDAFGRQIGRMNYDLQAQFYMRGVENLSGREDTAFVFLVQEITPPYACSLASLSNAYELVGAAKVKRALALWDRCLSTNNWPGYENRVHYIEPPAWQLAELEREMSL
jgi:PDDEXK-like domain of unknown function (DUF3799)